jgi:hypothetical protein
MSRSRTAVKSLRAPPASPPCVWWMEASVSESSLSRMTSGPTFATGRDAELAANSGAFVPSLK